MFMVSEVSGNEVCVQKYTTEINKYLKRSDVGAAGRVIYLSPI